MERREFSFSRGGGKQELQSILIFFQFLQLRPLFHLRHHNSRIYLERKLWLVI